VLELVDLIVAQTLFRCFLGGFDPVTCIYAVSNYVVST
jgi:hypothetical protein